MGKFSRHGLVLGILLAAIACSGGAPGGEGAAATVETFYDHLESGRYDEAVAMYDDATRQQLLPDAGAMDGFRQWAEMETDGLAEINVLEETTEEDSVTINFELTFDGAEPQPRSVTLTMVDGEWRMGVIG